MEANQFSLLLRVLSEMRGEFRRMADAAEAQVKETKAMREMVKTASLKAKEEDR